VGLICEELKLSERRACRVLGMSRTSCRYTSRRTVAPELLADLRQQAMERPRFGYRRLHVMLKCKGWRVNHKLVLRLLRENGWLVRRRQRKRLASVRPGGFTGHGEDAVMASCNSACPQLHVRRGSRGFRRGRSAADLAVSVAVTPVYAAPDGDSVATWIPHTPA